MPASSGDTPVDGAETPVGGGEGAPARGESSTAPRRRRGPRRSEWLRLLAVALLAAGAVVLGQALLGGGHHHSASGARGAGAAAAEAHGGGRTGGGAGTGSGGVPGIAEAIPPRNTANVPVAGGPAVSESLHHGTMVVVIDQPSAGTFSEQNRSIAQGAEVAVDELNAAGGLPGHVHVKLVGQSLDGLSAAEVRKRLSSEAAAAVILPCDTESQAGLAAGGAKYGTLMFAPCNPDPTAGVRYPTYWAVGMGADQEAYELATFMSTFGYRNAFLVGAPGSRYVELLSGYFREAAKAKGVTVSGSASIAMGSPDASKLAAAIKGASPRPSVVFTAIPPPFVGRLAEQLRADGVSQPIAGTAAMDTPLSLKARGQALENAIFTSYGFLREDASAQRFARDYRNRFHANPVGSFPTLGLETIRVLEGAVTHSHSAEPRAIQRSLSTGLRVSGVGLASRAYLRNGTHTPLAEVGIEKEAAGGLLPLFAGTPAGVPTP
jgi:branched-chain amino acid transport system substrate-binding protein